MSALTGLFNKLFGGNAELEAWKENNPEGYEKALAEESHEYLHVVDACRHEQGLEPLNPQERADFHLSDNPYEIQKMHGELIESLGDDAREWLNNQRTVADNIGLVKCLNDIGPEELADPSSIDDAIIGTKQLCDKYDIDPVEVAERYEIELDPELRDKLTGVTNDTDSTMEQNMPPPEYVASVDTPSMGGA